MLALRTHLPFRCASAGLCCSGARSPGGLPAAGCAGDVCRELQFHRQLGQLSFATSYGLDVSTSSSFNTYVRGYQNLNVGNVTRRSVTGLNPSTTYYFRVHDTMSKGPKAFPTPYM